MGGICRLRAYRARESRLGVVGVKIMVVVSAIAVMVAAFSSGLATAADPLIGKTYSDAASWISARNGTPVVSTVYGSQLALNDCVVTSWSRGGFLNSRGKDDRRNEYYVHLNCNNSVASAGHPGNSAVTPEGVKAREDQKTAARIAENPSWCERSDQNLSYCQRICKRTGLCEV